jgi:flagellar biosynthetic protein FliQ
MNPNDVASVARETILVLLYVSSPVMVLALLIGLIIGLVQALTSIQESTLTFVPKIILVFASLILLLPFMAGQLNEFATELFERMKAPEGTVVTALPTATQ